ncbi:hypothetical protein [Candidatus Regiella endosymbiont of Tuberolachnus salignus]|uniref:hypothetical protein n=1 Tax=Candidatus Regiella endosymbiont of Tuberolachnus salignus TaxID=3077956 RepID=UPI0030CB2E7C
MCKPTAELTTFVGTVTPYLPAKTTGSSSTGELITVQNSPSGITMSFDQSTTPVGEDQSTSQGSDAKERSSTSAALIAVSGQPLTLQKTDSREHDLSLSPSPVSQGNTFPVVADKNRCISVAGGNPLIPEDAETVPEAPAPTTTFFSTIKSWFTFPEIDFKQLIKDARQYNLLETTAKAAWKVGLLTASLITTAFVFFPPVTAALVGVGLVVAALGLIGGYAYTLYRAPEVSEQAAATTVSLVKNRSELCQARAGAAVAAEITFINGGGEEAIKTATKIGYTVANIGAKMNDTERAMAVIAALSMAIGQSELIGYLCLNPQLVKGSAGVGAGFGAFILGETKGTARVVNATLD